MHSFDLHIENFLCYGLEQAMGGASGQLGLVQVLPPVRCVTLSFLIYKTGDLSDPFSPGISRLSPSPPPTLRCYIAEQSHQHGRVPAFGPMGPQRRK